MALQMDILDRWLDNQPLKITCFIVLIGVLSCAKPKQPPLTDKESTYFKNLANNCNCSVSREINPTEKWQRPMKNEKDYYTLILDSLPLKQFQNIDSLKKESYKIAQKLHLSILKDDFKYPYDSITIFYSAQLDKINYEEQTFTYSVDSLNIKK